MALTRILGTAVRFPISATATAVGVAKGSIGVARRLVRHDSPWASTDEVSSPESSASPEAAVVTETVKEPEVVLLEPDLRDLPEPVVIYAEDDEPGPVVDPDGHLEVEEELVWTSESSGPPVSE